MVDTLDKLALNEPCPVYCLSMLQYGRLSRHVALVLKDHYSLSRSGCYLRIGIANEVPGVWFRDVVKSTFMIY